VEQLLEDRTNPAQGREFDAADPFFLILSESGTISTAWCAEYQVARRDGKYCFAVRKSVFDGSIDYLLARKGSAHRR